MITRYIHTDDAASYEAEGWRVSPLTGHHGAAGYALAIREDAEAECGASRAADGCAGAAVRVLLATIRGETSLDDGALDLLMLAEPDEAARKRLAVGLKTHRLITAEQCALMFYCYSLHGEQAAMSAAVILNGISAKVRRNFDRPISDENEAPALEEAANGHSFGVVDFLAGLESGNRVATDASQASQIFPGDVESASCSAALGGCHLHVGLFAQNLVALSRLLG